MNESSERALLIGFGLIVLTGAIIYAGVWWRHTHPTPQMLEERQLAQEQQLAEQALHEELCAEVVQVRQQPAAVAALTDEQWDRLVACERRLRANTDLSTTE